VGPGVTVGRIPHDCVSCMCLSQGKKGRKRGKKKSDLERDLEEAEAGPDARELALLQSQMLEVCVYVVVVWGGGGRGGQKGVGVGAGEEGVKGSIPARDEGPNGARKLALPCACVAIGRGQIVLSPNTTRCLVT
jgi:hypothetical protein